MNIELTIKSLVSAYNQQYAEHPIVVFDFVSLDNANEGKLMWWTYNVKEVNDQYKKFVLEFIGTGNEKKTLIKTEHDRDTYLYFELGNSDLLSNFKNKKYEFAKQEDPIGIDDNFVNPIPDPEVIESYEKLFKKKFRNGSSIWVSLPHTDRQDRKVYSAIFALLNNKITTKKNELDTYRSFRNFIVDYLIELYKAPLTKEISDTKQSLNALKKSNSQLLQKWIEDNPEFYVGTMMRQRLEQMLPAIQSDIPILIIGETGTGKEYLAKSIHDLSKRKDKKYCTINCSGYNESAELVDSEIFGHVKGAYTGATTDRKGILETYTDGTIFLDEIQQMPVSVQKKLKRVLDGYFTKSKEAVFNKVGGSYERKGSTNIKTKSRFIFATNQNIIDLVQDGKFLDDFFYRINIITITMPPLRERKEEILMLAEKFLNEENASNGYAKSLTEDAKRKLRDYHYPGNVRELRSILLRAYFLSGATSLIRDTDLHFDRILKHHNTVRLTKPDELSDETVFKTVCDLYEAHEKLIANKTKITNPVLVKALPTLPYGYTEKTNASAERSFKSTWLNKKHKADLEKIIAVNKDGFPTLEHLPFVNTVLFPPTTVKKSKK